MAFSIRNLSVLAYAQGFTLWHYKGGAATLAQAGAEGFFDRAADMLETGDIMMVSAADGGRLLFIAANSGGIATASLT